MFRYCIVFVILFVSHINCKRGTEEEFFPLYPVANSVNTFGAELLAEYRKEFSPNNSLVFSPINLASTLSLLHQGAGGTTKNQINDALNLTDTTVVEGLNGKSKFLRNNGVARMAYRLYIDKTINLLPSYINSVGASRVVSADFLTDSEFVRKAINSWVDKKTRGLIPKVLEKGDVSNATVMTLVNALHFKGTWKQPFDPNKTEIGDFYGIEGKQKVSFMTRQEIYLSYKKIPKLGGVMFEIPYEQNGFGMFVFLPDERKGWIKAEKKLPDYAGSVFDTNYRKQRVEFMKIPKWEIEFTFNDMETTLTSLGIKDIFTPKANFTNMVRKSTLSLSSVIHKAKIIVDEEGTEAAASTIAVVNRSAVEVSPVNITVNHPFLYFVVDRSDRTVLFQGTHTSFPLTT